MGLGTSKIRFKFETEIYIIFKDEGTKRGQAAKINIISEDKKHRSCGKELRSIHIQWPRVQMRIGTRLRGIRLTV